MTIDFITSNDDYRIAIDYRYGGTPIVSIYDADSDETLLAVDLIDLFGEMKADSQSVGPDHKEDLADALIKTYEKWLAEHPEVKDIKKPDVE